MSDEFQDIDFDVDPLPVAAKNTTVISPLSPVPADPDDFVDPTPPVSPVFVAKAAKVVPLPAISPELDEALDEFVADRPASIMQEPSYQAPPDPLLDAMIMRHQQHWAGRQLSNPNALRGPQAGPEAPGPRPVPRAG